MMSFYWAMLLVVKIDCCTLVAISTDCRFDVLIIAGMKSKCVDQADKMHQMVEYFYRNGDSRIDNVHVSVNLKSNYHAYD